MSENRLNAYHIMWLFVFFDLPVVTKKERKTALLFRKIRHCASYESQTVHVKRIKSFVPDTGMVSILSVTDKQYGDIVNFWGKEKKKKVHTEPLQLEFF